MVVVLALTANRGPSALLEINDGEVLYQPRRAHISFLPIQFLDEVQYPPSYNNHVLRESACFGFDRNPGYESWTPDGEYFHLFNLFPMLRLSIQRPRLLCRSWSS